MAKSEPSALVAAATAFDAELTTYSRLGELLLKSPLDTVKRLERVNTTLQELAESEGRLQQRGQQLLAALSAARGKQEQLALDVTAFAPTLQERNRKLQELMTALTGIAAEAAAINQAIAPGSDARPDLAEVTAKVMALSARSEQLAADARAAELAELAEQAHALHQRLLAVANKLAKASPS
jgi:DNA repair exonuclease SbcCD ATPase subunit